MIEMAFFIKYFNFSLRKFSLIPNYMIKWNYWIIFALHQIRALANVSDKKLKEASLRDIVIATGVLYDKERQERGQSENKNSISIILNLAHEANEKRTIDVTATVDKQPESVDK